MPALLGSLGKCLLWSLARCLLCGLPVDAHQVRLHRELGPDDFTGPGGSFPEGTIIARGRAFRHKFQEKFALKVQEAFRGMTGPAVLTISGWSNQVLANFLLNLERVGRQEHKTLSVVNTVLEEGALQTCRKLHYALKNVRVYCVDLAGFMPELNASAHDSRRGPILFTKPIVFQEAVKASRYGVLMSDIDVVHHKDLAGYFESLWKEEVDYHLITGMEGQRCCNTGTVFAKYDRSLPIMSKWVETNDMFYDEQQGDQSALQRIVVRDDPTPTGRLAGHLGYVPDGYQVFIAPETVVLQQCRKCRGCVGDCHGCDKEPYAIHYNCVNTHVNPEHTFRTHGDWSEGADVVLSTAVRAAMAEAHDWCDLSELGAAPGGPPSDRSGDAAPSRGGVW